MPNASKKKFKKEKVLKVKDAKDFAKGFIVSVGDKSLAYNKALLLQKAALAAPLGPDTKTANFWTNISGHISKA